MCLSKQQSPQDPAPVATPPPVVTAQDPRLKDIRDDEEAKARGRKGRQSTIVTGPLGLTTQANVAKKTALGQ